MLQTFIITFLLMLACIFIMSMGYLLNGKLMNGNCGNSPDNPCDCSFADKIKCSFKK